MFYLLASKNKKTKGGKMKKTMLAIALGVVVGLLSSIGVQAVPEAPDNNTDWAAFVLNAAKSFGLNTTTAESLSLWAAPVNTAVNGFLAKKGDVTFAPVAPRSETTLKNMRRLGKSLAVLIAVTAEDDQDMQKGLVYLTAGAKCALDRSGDDGLKAFLTGYYSASKVANFVDLDTVMTRVAAPAAGTY